MHTMTPFRYGGFYDVPRCIYLQYKGLHFLLLSEFDEDTDEYTTVYSLYVVPESAHSLVPCSPEFLSTPMVCIGQIPIDQVTFDISKRKELDASIIDHFVPKSPGSEPT